MSRIRKDLTKLLLLVNAETSLRDYFIISQYFFLHQDFLHVAWNYMFLAAVSIKYKMKLKFRILKFLRLYSYA